MLFNSIEFLFIFLPVAFLLFYISNAFVGPTAAKLSLIASSVAFYCCWSIYGFFILLASLVFNFIAVLLIMNALETNKSAVYLKVLLFGSVACNLGLLCYFKYFNLGISIINSLSGSHIHFVNTILPLGISFFTFQKIALLIDTHGRQVKSLSFTNYCLFVMFFPQLISGPLVHRRSCRSSTAMRGSESTLSQFRKV
jgi:D-alanyl-lipoteichoic acid acyltransferase DltB (MBOAT superfamily)